jgi:DNA-binding CsgD family transcriptional regulator
MSAAAQAFRRRGRPGAASAAQARATALAADCEGARTPALISETAITPLTLREREIAVLASQAVSNKDIAERLRLSVRTVGTHLQNAYGKLGITRRDQIAGMLTDLGISGAAAAPRDSHATAEPPTRTR